MANNIDIQQVVVEVPYSQHANVDLQQVDAEIAYAKPANIDIQQIVVELPFAISTSTAPPPGTVNSGLPGSVATTLFLWQIESLPDQVFSWRSQLISHGLKGYQFIGPFLASYAASDPVTLSFGVFDGTAPGNITLPSTANQVQRILLVPTFNKFRLIQYSATSAFPFQINLSEWIVKVGEWGRTGSYVSYRLLGEG